jgi:hypothetical protein
MKVNHTQRNKMPRRTKVVESKPTKFFRYPEITGRRIYTIEKGELIKVKDEWGMRFKFDSLVTNTETGAQWVDCFRGLQG